MESGRDRIGRRQISHFFERATRSVKARLGPSQEGDDYEGLSYTEFTYQLLQAYDFYYLNQMHNCNVQLGGSDQWGNITAGTDLIRRKSGRDNDSFGVTLPIVTNDRGEKFGKSAGNAIWLDEEMCSVFDFYQVRGYPSRLCRRRSISRSGNLEPKLVLPTTTRLHVSHVPALFHLSPLGPSRCCGRSTPYRPFLPRDATHVGWRSYPDGPWERKSSESRDTIVGSVRRESRRRRVVGTNHGGIQWRPTACDIGQGQLCRERSLEGCCGCGDRPFQEYV